MNFAVIIVAGGVGKRFGSKEPKQFLLLNNKKMFEWSIIAFKKVKQCNQIILVVPQYKLNEMQKYKKFYGIDIVSGGKERYNSVQNGLQYVKNNIDIVAIHDAARPLITEKMIKEVLKSATKYDGAILATKAKDTIKVSKGENSIFKTIDRNNIWQAQTPQMFKTNILKKVYLNKISKDITDDAQLVERLGKKVILVESSSENFKITKPLDFILAQYILKQRHYDRHMKRNVYKSF